MITRNSALNKMSILFLIFILVIAGCLITLAEEISTEEKQEISAYLLDRIDITEDIVPEPAGKSAINGIVIFPVKALDIDDQALEEGLIIGVILLGKENQPYLLFTSSLPEKYSVNYAAVLLNHEGDPKYVSEILVEQTDELIEVPSFSVSSLERESDKYELVLKVNNRNIIGTLPKTIEQDQQEN